MNYMHIIDYYSVCRYNIIIILSTHPLTFRRVKPVLFTTMEFHACKKIYTYMRAHRDARVYSVVIIYYF